MGNQVRTVPGPTGQGSFHPGKDQTWLSNPHLYFLRGSPTARLYPGTIFLQGHWPSPPERFSMALTLM